VAETGGKLISRGLWLGIDVGSARGKVFDFCLIKSDGNGQVDVLFEVGKARGPFPPCKAGVFEDLSRTTTWLSEVAEAGSIQILKESALVNCWNVARRLGNGRFGVCIDAPCGFAAPGFRQRNTESQSVSSFQTPPLEVFLEEMRRFSAEGNQTPLCQRFWKLVGLVAFRYFVALTTGRPFDMPIAELAASCMASEKVRVNEGFPSDTYKRANGTVGVLRPTSRGVLLRLSQAKWAGEGNCFNDSSSVPRQACMSLLLAHQQRLAADLQRIDSQRVPAMQKNSNAWGDLWDAFACAFVSCCDAQGCAGFVCSDPARGRREGAILRPDYC